MGESDLEVLGRLIDRLDGLRSTERQAFLARLRHQSPALRAELESLLRADRAAGDFIARPIFELPEPALPMDLGKTGYRLIGRLGEGGMSRVYLADQVGSEERFAVKLTRRRGDGLSGCDLLARERAALAALEHRNIARLHGFGALPTEMLDRDGWRIGAPSTVTYLVMEYVDGVHLDEACCRLRLRLEERIRLLLQVCDAVAFSHRRGFIHSDLKPSNIVVQDDGTAKLLDFGLAHHINARKPTGGGPASAFARWGTAAYASPEQARGRQVTSASDVYSLGVIVLHLAADARRGCQASTGRIVGDAFLERMHEPLRSVLRCALAPAPENRYASVDALRHALAQTLSYPNIS